VSSSGLLGNSSADFTLEAVGVSNTQNSIGNRLVRAKHSHRRRVGASELTGKRMQEGNALKAIYDSDVERRVCFYRNSDGTFGFLEWRFFNQEDSWVATRVGQGSRLSTIEDAVREATGRVGWLASALSPD
jgi:hypothetical protein